GRGRREGRRDRRGHPVPGAARGRQGGGPGQVAGRHHADGAGEAGRRPGQGAGPRPGAADTTAAGQKDHANLRVEEGGRASIGKALDATIGKDFQRAEMFSLPVTLLILLVAFGALIAAGVPVLLALSAVASAIGLSALASHLVPSIDAIGSVILLIGMA